MFAPARLVRALDRYVRIERGEQIARISAGGGYALDQHAVVARRAGPTDSARRRQRVITALDHAAAEGAEISAAGIARAARVDRTFLYRHHDLLEKIHALQTEPARGDGTGPAVTRASLQADLLAAHERAVRLSNRIQHLEKRLSQTLGDQAWHESGLGAGMR